MLKTKIKEYASWQRVLALFALGVLVFISTSHPILAQTLTQGYGTDQQLQRGMIVQLKESDTGQVEPVSYENIDKMHGVVVNANDAPVTLSADGQKVFVATAGHFSVLVSDEAGEVKPGDYITISSLIGIGMKAGEEDPIIVGRALEGFNGREGVVSESEITNTKGQQQTVKMGRVDTDISVSRNPLLRAKEPNLPEYLQRASEAIAGKPVNPIRVYLALIVFIVSAVLSGSLLFSGVKSAIISIGRNPLSKKSIIKGMIQVVITGIIIFLTGIFGVYLLIKL